MAALTAKSMGQLNQERRGLYPLFQKPARGQTTQSTPPTLSQLDGSDERDMDMAPKRSRNGTKGVNTSSQSRTTAPIDDAAQTLEIDPNLNRKKRRKTGSPGIEPGLEGQHNHISPLGAGSSRQGDGRRAFRSKTAVERPGQATSKLHEVGDHASPQRRSRTQGLDVPGTDQDSINAVEDEDSPQRAPRRTTPAVVIHVTDQKPKKLLQYNPKTGTIGSPPLKQKSSPIIEERISPVPKRTSERQKRLKPKTIIVPYGQNDQDRSVTGAKIDQILAGDVNVSEDLSAKRLNSSPKSKPFEGTPWWLAGKKTSNSKGRKVRNPPKDHDAAQDDSASIVDGPTSVLASPRSRAVARVFSKPVTSAFSGFGSAGARILKHPGAAPPAWPWKGMLHVRGFVENNEDGALQLLDANPSKFGTKSKKSKDCAVEVGDDEYVIRDFARGLNIEEVAKQIKNINLDDFAKPSKCLRLPIKHFESGRILQQAVRKELVAHLPCGSTQGEDSSEDELQRMGRKQSSCHPVFVKLYGSLLSSRSAFDKFECETQSWAHKYAPKCAEEVLQTGRQIQILREWLQTLKVLAVESGLVERGERPSSSNSRRPAIPKDGLNKRKRKSKKLEGFVVSSDEDESDDMDEITEPEDEPSPGRYGFSKKSVIRSKDAVTKGSKGSGKLTNAIVISGPNGCGKTAAVYAVAKELGFEVFEINPNSRRSGKDVLEKVGDMTRNHLVQGSGESTILDDLDTARLSDALAKDLKSGQQKTMSSFFKPRDSQKPKPKLSTTKKPAQTTKTAQNKAPTKRQKQSLILLEEVDTLYEDDKQFWHTIMGLITQSKRPIVMTCNDESAVPFLSLSLHAIVRFSPPPIDLAVDYMLLVVANEGHIIKREAIQALYESRNLDLRASIMELDLWCQFAIGDRKGGLEWLEPRWPPGSGLDGKGEVKRVISEGTYEKGMGWLSRDFTASSTNYLDIEEETLHEAWHGWDLDIGDWQQCPNLTQWAEEVKATSNAKAALVAYDDFAQSMSATDLCGGSVFALDCQMTLDNTLPALTPKARTDYPVAHDLLEATSLHLPHDFRPAISIYLKMHIRESFQIHAHIAHFLPISPLLDGPTERTTISLIRSHRSFPPPYLPITRQDFSRAFDPISYPATSAISLTSSNTLEHSIFDRSVSMIAVEVAPYVRAVVRYDEKLRQERVKLSGLLSEGGKGRPSKRMRTTRSAYSALEGGQRGKTRRERWLGEGVNGRFVEMTGGERWGDVVDRVAVEQEITGEADEGRMGSIEGGESP